MNVEAFLRENEREFADVFRLGAGVAEAKISLARLLGLGSQRGH